MTTEKDCIKRIMKEMVDYYLEHELYEMDVHVDYVPEKQATITIAAPYTELPEDLGQLEIGLSVEKHTEMDSMYNSLIGTHSRDKNYCALGQAIDDFRIQCDDGKLMITLMVDFF